MAMLKLRLATMDDAEILLQWRNDPETRSASHNTAFVMMDDHLRWLRRNLKDQFVKIYVGMAGDVPIGTVRINEDSTGNTLSWTIAPEHRRKGYGYTLVKAVAEKSGGQLKAQIKAKNAASRKIAESIGLRLEAEENGLCYYEVPVDSFSTS
jgi:RimJ/RimL family protein N-acetyltransferase